MGESGQGSLQFFKLRASFGQTGREPAAYSTLAGYSVVGAGLISSGSLTNSNLQPERQQETEAGFDLGMSSRLPQLDGKRLFFALDRCHLSIPLPPSSGVEEPATERRHDPEPGHRGAARTSPHPTRAKSVQWTLGLMWGFNRNELLALAGGLTEFGVPGDIMCIRSSRVGYPTRLADRQ